MLITHTKTSLQKYPTRCTYILLLKECFYLYYKTNKLLFKKTVFKSKPLPQFPPPNVLVTAVTPSSRDEQPEADVDILEYQRIRLEINRCYNKLSKLNQFIFVIY